MKKEFIKNCLKCNTEFVVLRDKKFNFKELKKERKFCSRKCSNSRTWSDEHKNNLSKKLKNKKQFSWNKGKKFPKKYAVKYCKDCSKELKNNNITGYCQTHLLLKKDLISSINRKAYADGKNFVAGGKTKWLFYKNIKVQGSYELRMCFILDAMKEVGDITNWEYTLDRFEYISCDGVKRNYLLDFKVFKDNSFFYIETKGRIRDNDPLKWETVRNLGFRLDVYFNDEIKNLEKKYKLI